MPLDLTDTLVVGISATALFDLSAADKMFNEKFKNDPDTAIASYRAYMLKHEDEVLEPGAGFPLVKALLELNNYQHNEGHPLVEVVIMSRNSPETGIRVLNTIRKIKRHNYLALVFMNISSKYFLKLFLNVV